MRAWGPLANPSTRDIAPPRVETELRHRAARAIDRAFAAAGGVPGDVQVTRRIPEGARGPTMVSIADRPSDLIVLGRSRHLSLPAPRTPRSDTGARRNHRRRFS